MSVKGAPVDHSVLQEVLWAGVITQFNLIWHRAQSLATCFPSSIVCVPGSAPLLAKGARSAKQKPKHTHTQKVQVTVAQSHKRRPISQFHRRHPIAHPWGRDIECLLWDFKIYGVSILSIEIWGVYCSELGDMLWCYSNTTLWYIHTYWFQMSSLVDQRLQNIQAELQAERNVLKKRQDEVGQISSELKQVRSNPAMLYFPIMSEEKNDDGK